MHLSPLHLLVLLVVVLVLFGKGKVTNLMGEFGRGITAFKKGVSEGNTDAEKAEKEAAAAAAAARDVTPPPVVTAAAPVEPQNSVDQTKV